MAQTHRQMQIWSQNKPAAQICSGMYQKLRFHQSSHRIIQCLHQEAVPPTLNRQVYWEIHETIYAAPETRDDKASLRTPMQPTSLMNTKLNSGLTFSRSSGCMCGATILSFSYQSTVHSTTRLSRQRPCVCSASSSVTTVGFGSRL